mmetsp:Transcript_25802/g.83321  ORF Transcript_25802/g.83321 Transcript_25802/m.83321 type:complete len:277 (-) Transcript_25802:89-919(-)
MCTAAASALDLSSVGAQIFAEDAATIETLRSELAAAHRETEGLRRRYDDELLALRTDHHGEVQSLRLELSANLATRRRLETELKVLREAASRLSAQEAAARETASESALELRYQSSAIEARMQAMQMQLELKSRHDALRVEAQLRTAQGQVETLQVQLRRRAGREARAEGTALALFSRCQRREVRLRLQAVFHWWSQLPKQNEELWDMHVFYLRKQQERHERDCEHIVVRYAGILHGVMLGGAAHHDGMRAGECFRAWALDVARLRRRPPTGQWSP